MARYGIEVVGAIFLAHFLRLNTSLISFNFRLDVGGKMHVNSTRSRLNHVEKDGAKAAIQRTLHATLTLVPSLSNARRLPRACLAMHRLFCRLRLGGNMSTVWRKRYDTMEVNTMGPTKMKTSPH